MKTTRKFCSKAHFSRLKFIKEDQHLGQGTQNSKSLLEKHSFLKDLQAAFWFEPVNLECDEGSITRGYQNRSPKNKGREKIRAIWVRINLLFYLFFTVVPSSICMFHSCRPFVVNTTFSTSTKPVENFCINDERPTGMKHKCWMGWRWKIGKIIN